MWTSGLVFLLAAVALQLAPSSQGFITKSVCEGGGLSLSCPSGSYIRIRNANYGRKDGFTCPGGPIKTDYCHSTNSISILQSACNGKRTCELPANNGVFGDPCVNTYKYLETQHECISRDIKEVFDCEHGEVKLSCPAETTIHIEGANYGRLDRNRCRFGPVLQELCIGDRINEQLTERCETQNSCNVGVTTFDDPCYGTLKYLEVRYICLTSSEEPMSLLTEYNITKSN